MDKTQKDKLITSILYQGQITNALLFAMAKGLAEPEFYEKMTEHHDRVNKILDGFIEVVESE